MYRASLIVVVMGLIVGGSVAAGAGGNQEKIDAVAAGEIDRAKASWWGFDAEDSTEALQKAIDSGVDTLVVDNVGGPWVVRPMKLASDQEIVFEKGVHVVAKPGEFKGSGDCLFLAANKENITLRGYGATLRMQKADYDGPNYKKAEWRHVLSIKSCRNIGVYGLVLADSGGDGIYLGTGERWVTNKDIHIKDCICVNNYRQGISVITAENLLIENTIMWDTGGTAPQAGIDFEPNHSQERLVNVVMRDCLTDNNAGNGYQFHLPNLNADSEPISMRFEHCAAVGDHSSAVRLFTDHTAASAVAGSIEFERCVFEGTRGPGISIAKPAEKGTVRFEDCAIRDTALEIPQLSPISLRGGRMQADAVGGIAFDNCLIRDPVERNPMSYSGGGVPLKDVGGSLLLEEDGDWRSVPLTEGILGDWMPVAAIKDISRLSFEDEDLRPRDGETFGAREGISWPTLRGAGRLLLYAEKGDDVSFVARNLQVGDYGGDPMPVEVTAPSGEPAVTMKVPFKGEATVRFEAPQTGVYRISADAGRNRFQIADSSHPLAIDGRDQPIHFIRSGGLYRFWVPAGAAEFGVRVAGAGVGEALKAELIDPSGDTVETVDNCFQLHQFEVELSEPSEGEAWAIRLGKPSELAWEDNYLDLRGAVPLLAPAGVPLLVPGE